MRLLLTAALAAALVPGAAAQTTRSPDEAAIVAADTAFDRSVGDRNIDAFLTLIAEDATFAGGDAPLHGRDAIRAAWARYFEPGGPTLRWTPVTAKVLVGRDVGVTTGTWVLRATNANGQPAEARGEYLTVWRKQTDGRWRAVYDTGSSPE